MKPKSIRQATLQWLSTWSHIPGSLIEKLAHADELVSAYDSDTFRLVASPLIECSGCGFLFDENLSLDELNRHQDVPCRECMDNMGDGWRIGRPVHAFPCAWGTLFVPNELCDQEWVEEHCEQIATLGFFVFKSEELGYILGIDGAGFDFYEALWIPLYRMRGLQWHRAME